MMPPAIWTGIYAAKNTCDTLRALRAMGWQWFELSTEHLHQIEQHSRQQEQIGAVRAALEELGARMPQAHAHLEADIAHPDESRREADMERIRRELICCADLGVEYVVLHPGTGEGHSSPEELRPIYQLDLQNLSRLADQAGELGVRIGLENTMDYSGGRHFGARPSELLDLLADLDHPALGICVDTSHAHVQKLDIGAAIREFGQHLCATHISDNDGSGDQHLTPGKGTINWPAVMAAFKEIGYQGIFNLEIPGESEFGTPPTPEVLEARIRGAFEVAQRLVSS